VLTEERQAVPATPGWSPGARPGGRLSWFERSWWTAAGLMLLVWSSRLVGSVSAFPAVTALVVVTAAVGLATVVASWTASDTRPARRGLVSALPWVVLAVTVAALGVWCLLQVYLAPGYGTDELAFDQYAAHLLLHGLDPYTHTMAPAFARYHVPPDGHTFRLDGSTVTSLSYPAPAFLVYVPLLAAGFNVQAAVALNVAAWVAAIVVVFALLPRQIRPIALVLGGLSVYIGYAVGGVTVALYVPLLAGAAFDWHHFGQLRGWRRWRGPVLLGLAMGINQAPWLVLPFAAVGVALEAASATGNSWSDAVADRRRRVAWRGALSAGAQYLGAVAVAFVVPNLVFVAWHPIAWAKGILTPLASPTVPAGQGLVALGLYLHLGGGALGLYSLLSVLTLLGLVVVYAATWPRLRPAAWLLPAVALLFATRSYGSYFVGLLPAALVAAVCARFDGRRELWRWWRPVTATVVAAVVAVTGLALSWPSPLGVRIESVQTTGQLATVDQVTVAVHNRTSRRIVPHFTLNSGDAVTSFWLARGPSRLAPGATASYTLLSPNFFAEPPISGGFQVVAFTTAPAAVSHSSSYSPTTDHLSLLPDAVDHTVPIGEAFTIRAQVLDRLDRPVRRAGIPVYLGQIVYAQAGLQYGNAIIDGRQAGQTPVSTLTDAAGVATFVVQGTQPTADPISFEANLVNQAHFYPYGYSQILPIRFGG
jgi:uncharacterized membrane protein